jgi:MFS family permease
MGFYQVLRSIGLAIGSAVSGVILAGYTHAHEAFPTVGGFRTALLLGAAICVMTAVLCYLLPGRSVDPKPHPADAEELLAMEESAEIAGAGLMLADASGEGRES